MKSPTELTAKNWERRVTSAIRCGVRKHRTFPLNTAKLQRFHMREKDGPEVARHFAEKAGVDWLIRGIEPQIIRFFD